MSKTTLYATTVTASGDGRNGHVSSDDGLLSLDLTFPKELGGAGGKTNPEQLFGAGYAACFHQALKLVASREHLTLSHSTVTATVSLQPTSEGGFQLGVALAVEVAGLTQAQVQSLTEKAHQVCPYSNAVRGNVEVSLTARVA